MLRRIPRVMRRTTKLQTNLQRGASDLCSAPLLVASCRGQFDGVLDAHDILLLQGSPSASLTRQPKAKCQIITPVAPFWKPVREKCSNSIDLVRFSRKTPSEVGPNRLNQNFRFVQIEIPKIAVFSVIAICEVKIRSSRTESVSCAQKRRHCRNCPAEKTQIWLSQVTSLRRSNRQGGRHWSPRRQEHVRRPTLSSHAGQYVGMLKNVASFRHFFLALLYILAILSVPAFSVRRNPLTQCR